MKNHKIPMLRKKRTKKVPSMETRKVIMKCQMTIFKYRYSTYLRMNKIQVANIYADATKLKF